jgi:hypothetical protein
MAQYVTFNDNDLIEYTDGVDTFRDGSEGGMFILEVLDGASWTTLETMEHESCPGTNVFRDGPRGGAWCTDQALTLIGFAGVESLDEGITGDWINLEKLEIE